MEFPGEQLSGVDLLDIIAEPANKFARAFASETLPVLRQKYRSGEASLKMLDETIKFHYISFFFHLHSPFVQTFDEKLIQLQEAGIIKHMLPKSKNKIALEEPNPQVLTMEHLEIGFISCLVPLFLSGIAFIVEILMRVIKMVSDANSNRII